MTGTVIIVSHGQPSDPVPAAADLGRLAERIANLLPGWTVASTTLAEDRALGEIAGALGAGLIFPMFMSGGYFTRVAIPERLRAAGVSGWQVLEPFGCDPKLHDLTVALAREAEADQVLLAAHGSFKSSVPSDIARHVAGRIAAEVGVRAEPAFIDQEPKLASMRGFGPGAVCLPFFAAARGHVVEDIPRALAEAGFEGRTLPPVGLDARVPEIVAAAILTGQVVCAGECQWRK